MTRWQPFEHISHRCDVNDRPFPQLIGLHGATSAGKSTVAAHLCGTRDYRAYSVADPLRRALYTLDPLLSSQGSLRELVDRAGWSNALVDRIHGPEVARLVAALRTGVAEEVFGSDVWVRRLEAKALADADLLGPTGVVVTDVTSAAEADWVHRHGGVVWHVQRPGHPGTAQLPDRLISAVITNDATVLALTRRVDRALAAIPRFYDTAASA